MIYIVLEVYCEPKSIIEIMNADDFVETENESFLVIMTGSELMNIQVKVLRHLACIELISEIVHSDDDGKLFLDDNSQYLIGEILTLKYF
jgi:hypothetical protein